MEKANVWLSWSSGKDCGYALHQLRQGDRYDVTGLLTTLRADSRSVAMHGTPEALLRRQAAELGLPLYCAEAGASQNFEEQMRQLLKTAADQRVSHIAFGDLFLEDIRAAREQKMRGTGIDLLFPLWQRPTAEVARSIIASGFKAVIVSVDLRALPASFLGRSYDEELLAALPPGIDPCGENGEFHSVVVDGPVFKNPIAIDLGEVTLSGDHGHIQMTLTDKIL